MFRHILRFIPEIGDMEHGITFLNQWDILLTDNDPERVE